MKNLNDINEEWNKIKGRKQMKRIIFLALFLSSGLHASRGCKEQSEQREVARAAEVQKLIDELEKFPEDRNWSKRKDIIARLIRVYDINPDDIVYVLCREEELKPLEEAMMRDDVIFASFLLNRGANPSTYEQAATERCMASNILYSARSKLMAQLLFGHGAQIIEKSKRPILNYVIATGRDPSLVPLYIQRGADVNAIMRSFGGTPLISAVLNSFITQEVRKQYISELLKAGALLSPKILDGSDKGLTAPAILKEQLDRAMARVPRDDQEITDLREIRAMMKRAYEEGECKIQQEALDPHLIPDLVKMCVESYQDLEQYQRRQ